MSKDKSKLFLPPTEVAELRTALLEWFGKARRPLPWREERSVYRTVVSEFMLQQTQVKTVLPYFARWLERFPDFASLARAPEEEVLKLWEGLGYYSRARNLHRLAKAVSALPELPCNAAAWRNLPGVGPYASAAIASIAQGEAVAVVDGNVVRVISRLLGHGEEFRDNNEAVEAVRPAADVLLNPAAPGDHNEAMMELGATVCLRNRPLCTVCPWVARCLAAASGRTGEIPKIRRKETVRRTIPRLWLVAGGRILLHRIPGEARRLAGQHELPPMDAFPPASLLVHPQPLLTPSRGIANERIAEPIHRADFKSELALPEDHHWHALDKLDHLTLVGPHRKWINQLLRSSPPDGRTRLD